MIVTLYMRSAKPEALERATHAFGGESEILAHDGPAESMSLSPLEPHAHDTTGRSPETAGAPFFVPERERAPCSSSGARGPSDRTSSRAASA